MKQTAFDGLQVVRREWECAAGCSEVCRTPEGTDCIRLRIRSAACQREFLRGGALPQKGQGQTVYRRAIGVVRRLQLPG